MSNQMGFRKSLWRSALDVHAVAGMYAKHPDIDILIPELRIAARIDSEFSQADSGDLKIRKMGCDWKTVEVKGYSADIKTLSGYPLIIVDRVNAYDAKEDIPDYYFAVAGCRKEAMFHDHKACREHMTTHKFPHQITRVMEDCYVLHKQYWKRIEL